MLALYAVRAAGRHAPGVLGSLSPSMSARDARPCVRCKTLGPIGHVPDVLTMSTYDALRIVTRGVL